MIFSGRVTSYRCESCASEFSNVTPTSLLPIAAVIALATGPWSRVVSLVVPVRWLAIALGVVASSASLGIVYAVVESITTRTLRRGVCPRCGASLTRTGAGFYDALVPNPWELLLYALVIALAFGVFAAVRPGTP